MLTDQQLEKATLKLMQIRGTSNRVGARKEILSLYEIYQALEFAQSDNSSPSILEKRNEHPNDPRR